MSFWRVALDLPLDRLFDYAAITGVSHETTVIGRRVVVPFGRGRKVGIVVDVAGDSDIPASQVRPAEALLDDMPALSSDWLELARFCAGYYQRALGEVIHAALPPRLKRPEPIVTAPSAYALTQSGRSALEAGVRGAKQTQLLQTLERHSPAALPADPIRRVLLERGWIEPAPAPSARPSSHAVPSRSPFPATEEQQAAVDAIGAALGRYEAFLLFGITGSGKTEVYLRLAESALQRGTQVLILVPEINLTPQLEQQVRDRLAGANVLTLTSALAESERAKSWIEAQSGHADLVLGTRLAVFTPLPRLGLVIVDEEHDASYKQQEGLRYSARDLAVYRANRANAPVVLGSATPALETYAHALNGRYRLIEMRDRARSGANLPTVRLVDMRREQGEEGLSAALAQAVEARLARGEQSLIFLNRRGYAPVLACGACGWSGGCPRCTAKLVVHLRDKRLRCHHCGHAQSIPRHCPECGNVDLLPFGRGTQRLEEALEKRFAGARILRADSDSLRNKGQWEAVRRRIEAGEVDILVGTQMLAKGHDFQRLTLVGVLNADAALLAADYRAPERLFAQLQQVAGRAGRANLPGEVLIQTRYGHHPLYQALIRHDYKGFAASLLEERKQAGFPPFVHEAVLRAESRDIEASIAFLQQALSLAPQDDDAVQRFDPVPMSLQRLGNWERAHVLLQSPSRPALQRFLRTWSGELAKLRQPQVRWHLDVDPIDF